MLSLTGLVSLLAIGSESARAATGYTHPTLKGRAALTPRWHSDNPQVTVHGSTCTVEPLGGGLDDGPNLLYAFELCGENALIELPGYYTVNTVLSTYLHNVEVRLQGAISYVPDIAYWSPASIFMTYQNATTYWFFSGDGVTLNGGGTIDANGQTWWDYYTQNKATGRGVAGGSTRVFARPIPLTVGNATNVKIQDISVINSPFWSNFVYQSSNVEYDNIKIRAISANESAPAANSDGWDIYRSSHVYIHDSHVVNGDDCVSFKPNSTYMRVENMYCNGSHGISIGSLGQYAGETDIVSDIYVKNISMNNAENGARIKVFAGSPDPNSVSGGGSGYVRNVTFEDFHCENCDNPILIDQCYQTASTCAQYPSTLSISDVHYINVSGTSSGVVKNGTVATLKCSETCQDITATGTDLRPPNGTAQYLCSNLANESTLDFTCTHS